MTTITIPRADIPLVDAAGTPTRDLYRWMRDVTQRVGGVNGASTTDLSAAAFEDAGIEETKALAYSINDAANQQPPVPELLALLAQDNQRLSAEVEELRGLVVELYKLMQGALQGVVLQ